MDASYYCKEADSLLHDIKEAVLRERKDTRFGILPPFRLGYTPTPLTLSNTRETFFPVTEEEALYLLRGIPAEWFESSISFHGLVTHWGPVSLEYVPGESARKLVIELPELPEHVPVYVDVRGRGSWKMKEDKETAFVTESRVRLPKNVGKISLKFILAE